jgi:hypothetical protein
VAEPPRFKIRGVEYEQAATTRLGDPALIEALTGLKHSEWRRRYVASLQAVLDQQEAIERGEEPEGDYDEDALVTQGILGMAIARKHPTWSRSKIVEFVNGISYEEIEILAVEVEEDPTTEAATEAPSSPASGTEPASHLSSDSDSGSKQSLTLASSGPPTLGTSAEAQ